MADLPALPLPAKSDAEAILEVVSAVDFAEPRTVEFHYSGDDDSLEVGEPKQFVIVPEKARVHEFAPDRHAPRRIAVSVKLATEKGFGDYVDKYKALDTVIFADSSEPKIAAIVDYHGALAREASFGVHRATYTAPLSQPWQEWVGADKKVFGQAEFAEFIEDHASDIAENSPASAAALMEMARNLSLKSNVEYRGALNPQNGTVQLQYVEVVEGDTQRGAVRVPERFTLALPVFEGGAPVNLPVRLRYRLGGGKCTFHFVLDRPDLLLRREFAALVQRLREKFTALLIVEGPAPEKIW